MRKLAITLPEYQAEAIERIRHQRGVPRRSVANADDIITVDTRRSQSYICTLSSTKLAAVERTIKFALDLS